MYGATRKLKRQTKTPKKRIWESLNVSKLDQSKPTGPKNAISQSVKSGDSAPSKSGPKIKITPPLHPLPKQTSKSVKTIQNDPNEKRSAPKVKAGEAPCFDKKGRC